MSVCLALAALLHAALLPAAETGSASPQPSRVVLTWASDPSTSMSVSWRTDTSVERGRAEIVPAQEGPKFNPRPTSVDAVTSLFKLDDLAAHQHTVRFTGLKPGSEYMYRVGDGSNWSEWHHFRTAAAGPEPLTFLYSADAQNDILAHWSRVLRAGVRFAPEARFIVHAGDLVNTGNNDRQWGEWFAAGGWIHATIPSLPAPGNHDYPARKLTPHWRAQFDLPENGPPGLEETCYYVDIQGVRVISLNSNEQLEEQARWLDGVLAGNTNRWTVAVLHHPLFSSARGRDSAKVRAAWQPVFDKHAVDLVLQGHDHTYARSGLMRGEGADPEKSGTVYVVSVGGTKMYRLEPREWMKRPAEDTQFIQIIRVDGGRLRFEARTPTGRLHDAFELRKRAGRANLLVEDPSLAAPAGAGSAAGGR